MMAWMDAGLSRFSAVPGWARDLLLEKCLHLSAFHDRSNKKCRKTPKVSLRFNQNWCIELSERLIPVVIFLASYVESFFSDRPRQVSDMVQNRNFHWRISPI